MTWHEGGEASDPKVREGYALCRKVPQGIKRDPAFRGWLWPSGRVYKTDLEVCQEGEQ